MHEHLLSGRIVNLRIFNVPDFGTRASFKLECPGRDPVTCAVAGDVAREFVTGYRDGDIVAVTGTFEARPSTAASQTPWSDRLRVRAVHALEVVWAAA